MPVIKKTKHSLRVLYNFVTKDISLKRAVLGRLYRNQFRKMKNAYAGQRCFIIGNGPSLKPEDLDRIAGEYTFAFNRIFHIFPNTKWRPSFFMSQDMRVVGDSISNYVELCSVCDKVIINNMAFSLFGKEDRKKDNLLFFHIARTHSTSRLFFSDDISRIICGGSNIAYAAMQCAVYFGFKEIYLLGMDHSFSLDTFKDGQITEADVKKNYFKGMPKNVIISKTNFDRITLSFLAAKQYADTHGIQIFNATRGGKLEVFPRVDFDKIEGLKS